MMVHDRNKDFILFASMSVLGNNTNVLNKFSPRKTDTGLSHCGESREKCHSNDVTHFPLKRTAKLPFTLKGLDCTQELQKECGYLALFHPP